jgi:hypothetical protein
MTNSSDEREVLKAQLKNAATDKNMADLQRIYDYVFGEDDSDSSLPSETVTDSLMSAQDKKN